MKPIHTLALLALLSLFACTPTSSKDSDSDADADADADADSDTDADADCSVVLPATTQVVRTQSAIMTNDNVVWACSGAVINATGNTGLYVIESGSTLNLSGNDSTAYALTGSTANVSGNSNVIYSEILNVTNTGTGNTINDCTAIAVDSSAVTDPC